tara:strand:+ start:290 stop:580 length:291 start_codon:yes stop_codon:yes gene_type:complete
MSKTSKKQLWAILLFVYVAVGIVLSIEIFRKESNGELKTIEIEYSKCENKFNAYKNLWMKQHFLIHLDTMYNVRTVEEWCEKYDSLNCDTTFLGLD